MPTFADHPMAERLVDKTIDASKIGRFSVKILDFYCPDCKHEFPSKPINFKEERYYCSYCSNAKLCGKIECVFCLKKSFLWYCEYSINMIDDNVTPIEIFPITKKEFIFKCPDCNHVFPARTDSIRISCSTSGKECPYCNHRKLCGKIECDECLKKSFFGTCEYSINMIDDDIEESALDLLPRSSKRYPFKCPDCKHIFPASMGSMYDGKECPFCDNCRLCEDEKLYDML